jgi:hypothetical protein
MPTYSSYTYPIESTNINDISGVLSQIPDNTAKLVSPKDVRDGLFTLWENIPFKFTSTPDNLKQFIGLGGMGANVDLKMPMYFGKHKFSNTEIMTSSLLSSDMTDFYFYNNKLDNVTQNTRISILSGTSKILHNSAPYIESKFISGANYSNLVIMNTSTSDGLRYGNIEITAGKTNMGEDGAIETGGNIYINGLSYNKYYDPGELSTLNNQVLRYNHTKGRMELSADNEIDSIYSTGLASITGFPVRITSNDIEIPLLYSSPKDDFGVQIPVPLDFGGIKSNETFTDATYESMLNRLLYAYELPSTDLGIVISPNNETNGTSEIIYEYGNILSIGYTFSIKKTSNNISSINPINLSNFPTIVTPLRQSYQQTMPLSIPTSVVSTDRRKEFKLSIIDDVNSTVSSSVFLSKVYPYMWGTSTNATNVKSVINAMIRDLVTSQVVGIRKVIVNTFSEMNFDFVGDGVCIYYMHPKNIYLGGPLVPSLTSITYSGFEFINSFTKYELLLTSDGKWSDVPYVVYVYTPTTNTPNLTTVGDLNTNYRATYKIKH